MLNQEHEPNEDAEITLTAIIEQLNKSDSFKNSSMQEEIQADLRNKEIESIAEPKIKANEGDKGAEPKAELK